eukprot:1219194-Prymnesium_polylepis.1
MVLGTQNARTWSAASPDPSSRALALSTGAGGVWHPLPPARRLPRAGQIWAAARRVRPERLLLGGGVLHRRGRPDCGWRAAHGD